MRAFKNYFCCCLADVTWADVKELISNKIKTKIKHLSNFLEWPLLSGEDFNLNNLSKCSPVVPDRGKCLQTLNWIE